MAECFAINPYTTEIRTNTKPPLVGVGEKWELLLSGISSLYLPRKGIKYLYKNKENIELKKNSSKFRTTLHHNWYSIYIYIYFPFAILKWRLTT